MISCWPPPLKEKHNTREICWYTMRSSRCATGTFKTGRPLHLPTIPKNWSRYISNAVMPTSRQNVPSLGGSGKAIKTHSLKKRYFQSLVHLLQHASKVVVPGKAFTRRLHKLLSIQSQWVRLNSSLRADILRWQIFSSRWNGFHNMASIQVLRFRSCRGIDFPAWFELQQSVKLHSCSIQLKEMLSVMIVAAILCRWWKGKNSGVYCG